MDPILLLLIALVIGLAAGILSGMFGIGGGIIMVPALIAAGLASPTDHATSFNIATACSLFAIIFLSPTGSYVHMRANHLNVKYGLALGIAGVIGGVIGSYFSKSLPQDWLEGGFAVFTILMGVQMMLRDNKEKKKTLALEENGDCTPEVDRKESSEFDVRNPNYGFKPR